MAFEEFKHYCPECGEQVKLTKSPKGSFRCSVCDCQYRRNWSMWLCLGIPAVGFGIWLVGAFAQLWSAPEGAVFIACAALAVAFVRWGDKDFVIVEHGRAIRDSDNEHVGS
jgi:hypothetical protein